MHAASMYLQPPKMAYSLGQDGLYPDVFLEAQSRYHADQHGYV